VLLWPTGVGEGEFIERDTLPFMGGWLQRVALVCQAHVMMVWYRSAEGGVIQRGDQAIANMVVTSFEAGPGAAGRQPRSRSSAPGEQPRELS
jgi:hypothetical protein